jgi:hypothetical protein
MTHHKARLATTLAVAIASWSAVARGDAKVEADALFQDGKTLVKDGKLAEACEAFAASQRLDPALSTLLNLANCRELNRQLATAWSLYLEAARVARREPINPRLAEVAQKRAAALEPRLSHLGIGVSVDSRIAGLEIARNGEPLDPAVWNRAIATDIGRYVITARAPGHEPWSRTVEISGERETQSIDVPKLSHAVAAAPTIVTPKVPASGEPATATHGRTLALALGAASVIALGIAAGFEISGRTSYDMYKRSDSASGEKLYDSANTKHHVAQGLASAGIAGAATALYLWWSGTPARSSRSARLVPVLAADAAGLALTGAL